MEMKRIEAMRTITRFSGSHVEIEFNFSWKSRFFFKLFLHTTQRIFLCASQMTIILVKRRVCAQLLQNWIKLRGNNTGSFWEINNFIVEFNWYRVQKYLNVRNFLVRRKSQIFGRNVIALCTRFSSYIIFQTERKTSSRGFNFRRYAVRT